MVPRPRTVHTQDGLTLHLVDVPTGGTPCLLLHGFGHEAHVWDDFVPFVVPWLRPMALDFRGHGESDWDPQARYDRATLVGEVATCFAATEPDRVRALVLVDTGPELNRIGVDHIRADTAASPRVHRTVDDYARHLADRHVLARPSTLARLARHGVRRRDDGLLERRVDPTFERGSRRWRPRGVVTESRYVEPTLWDALGRIRCPTLVVRGVRSGMLAKDVAERMPRVLRDGRLVTVPLAGHVVMVDNPEGFGEEVSSFLRRSVARWAR